MDRVIWTSKQLFEDGGDYFQISSKGLFAKGSYGSGQLCELVPFVNPSDRFYIGRPDTFFIAWSHCGNFLAALSGPDDIDKPSVVEVYDIRSRKQVFALGNVEVGSIQWSPDGKYLVGAGKEFLVLWECTWSSSEEDLWGATKLCSLELADLLHRDGKTRSKTGEHNAPDVLPGAQVYLGQSIGVFSPDSQHILLDINQFEGEDLDGRILVVSLESLEGWIMIDSKQIWSPGGLSWSADGGSVFYEARTSSERRGQGNLTRTTVNPVTREISSFSPRIPAGQVRCNPRFRFLAVSEAKCHSDGMTMYEYFYPYSQKVDEEGTIRRDRSIPMPPDLISASISFLKESDFSLLLRHSVESRVNCLEFSSDGTHLWCLCEDGMAFRADLPYSWRK
ncbi:MAG: WD40 repeat domain-containing protein [Acidobacteria bacterium]|nr:WD40 repeat domain-containing protein [Acidobacteriota bacterium]